MYLLCCQNKSHNRHGHTYRKVSHIYFLLRCLLFTCCVTVVAEFTYKLNNPVFKNKLLRFFSQFAF